MKKLKKILLIIYLILFPINILACPHIDDQGEIHLQTYNEDYTEVNMIYPKEGYLYSKIVLMKLDQYIAVPLEDKLVNEGYGFAILQDMNSYLGYYSYFMDESLYTTNLEDLDIDITIENTPNQIISNDNYTLNIGLTNTYKKGLANQNTNTTQIYYDVYVDVYNEDDLTNNQNEFLNENKISEKISKIYNITADFMNIEIEGYIYSTNYDELDEFYDDIVISIDNDKNFSNPVAVNIDNIASSDEYIEVTEVNDKYEFTINQKGTYIITESFELLKTSQTEEKEEIEEEIIEDIEVLEAEDTENDNSIIIYAFIGIISLFFIIIVIKILMQNKKN